MQDNKQIIGSLPSSAFAPRLSPGGTGLADDLQEQQEDGSKLYFNREGHIYAKSLSSIFNSTNPPEALLITGFVQGQYQRQF